MLPFLFMCNNNRGSKTPPPLMEIETKKTENNIFLSVSIPLKINNVEYKEHVLKFEYSIQNLSDSTLLIYKPYVEKGFETGIFKTTLTNKNNMNNKFDLIWLKDDGSCDKIKLRPIELTMNKQK